MGRIILKTYVNSSPEQVFDIARSIDFHTKSAHQTYEKAISGRKTGLMELGETTRWRAKHFGFWFEMEVSMVDFAYPFLFTDEMIEGNFAEMRHVHTFKACEPNKTIMIDDFYFRSPYWIIGMVVDKLFLNRYMKKFLEKRNALIKMEVEGRR